MFSLNVFKVVLHAIPMQIVLHAKLDGIMMLKINNASPALSTVKPVRKILSLHYLPAMIVKTTSIGILWAIACYVMKIVKVARGRGIIVQVVPVAMH